MHLSPGFIEYQQCIASISLCSLGTCQRPIKGRHISLSTIVLRNLGMYNNVDRIKHSKTEEYQAKRRSLHRMVLAKGLGI